MLIQDALKETGKARREGWREDNYIFIGEHSTFETSEGVGYYHVNICDNDWQLYHEVKEIRPENAGELWFDGQSYYHTERCHDDSLIVVHKNYGMTEIGIIHNKNGWTRLYPPVEDDSIERIEIEGVEWESNRLRDGDKKGYSVIFPEWKYSGWEEVEELLNKPSMKMILEIPKETS